MAKRKRHKGQFTKKTNRRRAPVRKARRSRGPIRGIMSSKGGFMKTAGEAAMVGGGLIAGQYIGQLLSEKVEALKDGKMRGGALLAIGILGANYAPKSLRGVAIGVAASGAYQLAKELLPPGTIAGELGALSPAEVDMIENMALESEVNGMDDDIRDTVTGGFDGDVVDTVTGADDDDDDDAGDY